MIKHLKHLKQLIMGPVTAVSPCGYWPYVAAHGVSIRRLLSNRCSRYIIQLSAEVTLWKLNFYPSIMPDCWLEVSIRKVL